MNQQIIDGNKLIAEFDGVPTDIVNNTVKYLEYHKDWNWIMPVVEKIGLLKNRIIIHRDFKLIYCEIICRINGISKEILEFDKTSINATYKAVVKFIKWYNKEVK